MLDEKIPRIRKFHSWVTVLLRLTDKQLGPGFTEVG